MTARDRLDNAKVHLAWRRLVNRAKYQDLWNNTQPMKPDEIDADIRRLFRLEGTIPEFALKFLVGWFRADPAKLASGHTARKDRTVQADRERALKIEEKIRSGKGVASAIREVLIEEKIGGGSRIATITEGETRRGWRSWEARKRLLHPWWRQRPKQWIDAGDGDCNRE